LIIEVMLSTMKTVSYRKTHRRMKHLSSKLN